MSIAVGVADLDAHIRRLLEAPPRLHMNEQGELVNFQIDARLVPHLRALVHSGARTMETGSGISTIVLLMLGADHTSITPDGGEAERITAYCVTHGVPVGSFHPIVARSEDALPTFAPGDTLDLAIVDGNHAFPAPFVDWFYLSRMLKPGGVIVVDDVELWTGAALADFLDDEEGMWERVERNKRFAIYRLVGDKSDALERSWVEQPYVVKGSDLRVVGLAPNRAPPAMAREFALRLRRVAARAAWKLRN